MTGVTRFCANLFSYLFHPLFISTYVMAFLIFVHPMAFSAFDQLTRIFRFITIISCNVFFPLFSVFLMWRLKLFLTSMYLRDQKDRIVPYMIAMIFYFWTWYAFKNLPDTPEIAVQFLAGSFLALIGAFLCNIWFKISIHTVALGNALLFFFLFSFTDDYASGLYLSIVLAITGLVATCRLLVGHHTRFEVWAGLFVGILAQLIGWYGPL